VSTPTPHRARARHMRYLKKLHTIWLIDSLREQIEVVHNLHISRHGIWIHRIRNIESRRNTIHFNSFWCLFLKVSNLTVAYEFISLNYFIMTKRSTYKTYNIQWSKILNDKLLAEIHTMDINYTKESPNVLYMQCLIWPTDISRQWLLYLVAVARISE